MIQKYLALLLLCFVFVAHGQQKYTAVIYDEKTKLPVSFATIKFGGSGNGAIADINGVFDYEAAAAGGVKELVVSCLGYEPIKLQLPLTGSKIYLKTKDNTLTEVWVKPQYEKIYRILNMAIANKNNNNPELYDWYRCKVYYKMVLDLALPAAAARDTSKSRREFKNFTDDQHMLMTETYSQRTWKRPQELQEVVLGSRFSGFRKSMVTGLVTDVLPFHAYSNYMSLNGKDYHNPISNGYKQHYKFNLSDEFMLGDDTVWILSFNPIGKNGDELKGKVFINSHGYAISNIVARAIDSALNREIVVEHQYRLVKDNGEEHWFPAQLNYIINLKMVSKTGFVDYKLTGNSFIDSVTFKKDEGFKFDKRHTVKLLPHADELDSTAWNALRPLPLDGKEVRSYRMVDSIGNVIHADRFMNLMAKLPEGKLPIACVDVELKRLFSANYYEKYRFGLGAQTNEKILKWASVGGWAGYGIHDKAWKYGAFAEVYLDDNKEFAIKAAYEHDLSDPGRIHLSGELDKNYLKSYLLRRVDEVNEYSVTLKKKVGYWNMELAGKQQEILPKYAYTLAVDGVEASKFTAQEGSLNVRYAYAERTAPVFKHYVSIPGKYPIVYGRFTYGNLQYSTVKIAYMQVVVALAWQKHFNRLGSERFLVESGKIFSNGILPISKLFAGNGFRNSQQSIYTFGGFMTMLPYEFYTDQFVSGMWRHDFDWKLYRFKFPNSNINSSPFLGMQYNYLYGTLKNPGAQRDVEFGIPDKGYHEAGIVLSSLIRIKYLNLYYITLNFGYFYHITPAVDLSKNGRFVYGIGVEF